MLLINAASSLYRVAQHPMQITQGLAYYNDAPHLYMGMFADATTDFYSATIRLNTPLPQTLVNPITATWSTAPGVGVTGANLAIDGNPTTLAVVTTATLDSNTDGYGTLRVQATPVSTQRGNNQWQLTLTNHRRGIMSDPTTTGTFIARTVDQDTGNVLRDNLFRTEAFRHALNPRTTVHTITGLALGPSESIEIELVAQHEGGVGTASNTYEIGEVGLQVRFQSPGDNAPIFLYQLASAEAFSAPLPIGGVQAWAGRLATSTLAAAFGVFSLTGPGTYETRVLQWPHEVIGSLLVDEVHLPLVMSNFAQASLFYVEALSWHTDGGIGGGWATARAEARDVLDKVAKEVAATLVPDGDGAWQLFPYDPDHTPAAAAFDPGSILRTSAQTATRSIDTTRDSSMQVTLGTLQDIHARFEVAYGYNPGSGKYDKLRYVDAHGTNSQHPDALTVQQDCKDAQARFGELLPYHLDAEWTYEDRSADFLLTHLAKYWSDQRITAEWDGPIGGVNLRPGQFVTVAHPYLPLAVQGQPFELHTVRLQPSQGRIHYQASRRARPKRVITPCPPLPQGVQNGLAAGWTLDEESGDRADVLGGVTLTDLHGTVGQYPGRQEWAAQFTPTRQSTLVAFGAPHFFDHTFTFAMWVYPFENPKSPQGLFTRSWSVLPVLQLVEYYIRLLPGGFVDVTLGSGSGGTIAASTLPLAIQRWNLLTLTHDGTTVILRINNVVSDSVAPLSGFGSTLTYPIPTCLGSMGGLDSFFWGAIDTTLVWSRVLTQSELDAVWNGGLGGCPQAIVGQYFAIQDQNGVVWYFWFDIAGVSPPEGQLNDSSIPPVGLSPLTTGTVPSWHQVNDETGAPWYLYPDTQGQLQIFTAAPPLGVGLVFNTTSPDGIVAIGLDGFNHYRLTADSLGQIQTPLGI
jgi:hypothetical protein